MPLRVVATSATPTSVETHFRGLKKKIICTPVVTVWLVEKVEGKSGKLLCVVRPFLVHPRVVVEAQERALILLESSAGGEIHSLAAFLHRSEACAEKLFKLDYYKIKLDYYKSTVS